MFKIAAVALIAVTLTGCKKTSIRSVATSADKTTTTTPSTFSVTLNQKSTQVDPSATAAGIQFEAIFSSAISPATFTNTDIIQNGTAAGVTWLITDTGDHKKFTLTTVTVGTVGTVKPYLSLNAVQDSSGNYNTASTSTDDTVTFDNTTFSVAINQGGAQADPTNNVSITYTAAFNRAINLASFVVGDITNAGTATGVTWSITDTGNSKDFILTVTGATSVGTIKPSIAAGAVQDTLGNNNTVSTATDNTVTYDNVSPTITNVTSALANGTYTTGQNVDITIAFSEAVYVVTTGGTPSLALNSGQSATYLSGSGSTTLTFRYTVVANDTSADLNYVATNSLVLNGGTIADAAANAADRTLPGTAAAGALGVNKAIVIDATPLTVTINQVGTQADPTANSTITWDVVFSKAITPATFIAADLTHNGTATGVTYSVTDSGDHINFTVATTAITGDGTARPSLAANKVQDPAGNNNSASTTTDSTVTYDTTGPAITNITSTLGNGSYTVGQNVDITITFNEAVTVNTAGGTPTLALNTSQSATYLSGSTTSTLTFRYTVGAGENSTDLNYVATNSLALNSGTMKDAAGNNATLTLPGTAAAGSLGTNKNIVIDTTAPTVTNITSTLADGSYTVGQVVDVTVTFSKAVTVSTVGGTPTLGLNTSQSATYLSGSTTNTLTFRYTVGTGENATDLNYNTTTSLFLNLGTIKDAIGNNADLTLPALAGVGSLATNKNIVIDTSALTVTVNQLGMQADPTNNATISYAVVFNKAIAPATFTTADITQNGTASGITWGLSTTDNISWTLQSSAVTGSGTLIPSIATAKVKDLAGNDNDASTTTDSSVTYDGVKPVVTITAPLTTTYINNANKAAFTVAGACTSTNVHSTDGNVSVTIADATTHSVSNTAVACVAGAYTVNLNATTLDNGTNNITATVTQVDAAGNTSTAATVIFSKEVLTMNLTMAVPLTTGAVNNSNKAAFMMVGNCTVAAGQVHISVDTIPASSAITADYNCTANSYNNVSSLNLSALADGPIRIIASQTSTGGNTNSLTRDIVKDVVVPTVTITTPITSDYILNANVTAFTVSGTCVSTNISTNETDVTVVWNDGSAPIEVTTPCVAGTFTTTQDVSSLLNGPIDVSAAQYDGAANSGSAIVGINKAVVNPPVLLLKASTGVYTDLAKTTPAVNGDLVQVWEDQSGNGNDAIQTTDSFKPKLATSGINTLPSIRFTTTPKYLDTRDFTLAERSVFIVYKNAGAATVIGTGSPFNSLFFHSGGGYHQLYFEDSTFRLYDGSTKEANIQVTSKTGMLVSEVASGADGAKVYLNGGTDAHLTSSGTDVSSVHTYGRIGGHVYGGGSEGYGLNGDISEIRVYDYAMDDAARAIVEAELKTTYGLDVPEIDNTWTPHWNEIVSHFTFNGPGGEMRDGDRLDATTGPNAIYHTSGSGILSWLITPLKQGLAFASADNTYVDIDSYGMIGSGHNEMTMNIWFKMPNTSNGVKQTLAWMGSDGNGCTNGATRVSMYYHSGRTLGVENCGSYFGFAFTPDDKWHMFTVVFPAGAVNTDEYLLYLDGVRKGSVQLAGTTVEAVNIDMTSQTATTHYMIGGGTGFNFVGGIEEPTVWSVGLSDSEVQSLYDRH